MCGSLSVSNEHTEATTCPQSGGKRGWGGWSGGSGESRIKLLEFFPMSVNLMLTY